jgi:serine/threonine protein kinase
MIGKILGHYKILEQLGRGGMGEVYLADDTTLDRKVALKFLPDVFTGDPERMARFEREAKLLASLNHPNIAAIYGLEQADGKRFLIMEYVEGETLQSRIGRGALPLEEALAVCKQIAEGLEAAHEKGVIHRDLKPANVMITGEEKIKILDFGLAKALSDDGQSIDSSQSPTITEAMTRPGVVLGTAAYMSPEQAKGKAVDKRADIWAFGCILYECLSGKRVFEGETVTETLASVIKEEPDIEKAPAKTRFLLRKCLVKDPKDRLRDIGDASALLELVPEPSPEYPPAKRLKIAWIWATTLAVLVITSAVLSFLYLRGQERSKATSFHLAPTHPMPTINYSLAISPDGKWIVFVASLPDSKTSLYLYEVGSVTPTQLHGTEGAQQPFWSPDSRSIGFFAGRRLKTMDIPLGTQQDICEVTNSIVGGGTWSDDGIIIYSDWPALNRVSVEEGEPVEIAVPDSSAWDLGLSSPYFLPDGHHYIYTAWSAIPSKRTAYLGSLDSGEKRELLAGVSKVVYTEPGYLIFQRERELFARRFDAKRLTFNGEPFRIANNILINAYGQARFGASQNGLLVYRSTTALTQSQFLWFDRNGTEIGPAGKPGLYITQFDLSPDGKRIAVSANDPGSLTTDVWLIELERDTETRLTVDEASEPAVVWSPDGMQVGFSSTRSGNIDIYKMNANGVGEATPMADSSDDEWLEDWSESEDGQYISYETSTSDDLHILPLFGDRKPFTIIPSPFDQDEPHFSPDVKWLVYDSNESGTWEVYVVSFPEADQKQKISTNGGVSPRWRGDGKEIYYLSLEGEIMAVDFKADQIIEAGKPHVLFDADLDVIPKEDQYDVTRDGQRFLILKPLADTAYTPITVTLNWTSLIDK